MRIESTAGQPEKERKQPSGWRRFLRRFGLGTVEPVSQRRSDESGTGNADQPPVGIKVITAMEMLENLDRKRAEKAPADLPEPYELGAQEYPGNSLFRSDLDPRERNAVLEAVAMLEPAHVVAERNA
jgi:hypothetical protein